MAHEHHHQHEPENYNRAFAIGVALNVGFVLIEATYGVTADSPCGLLKIRTFENKR